MPKEHIQKWHGAHHYSDRVHLLLIVFIFFTVFTLLWSYFTLSNIRIKDETKIGKPSTEQTAPTIASPTATPVSPKPSSKAEAPTFTPSTNLKQNRIYCTQEAKLCPNGTTYVGRTGPNCEFSACPTN
jgi:hypothetical protein